MAGTVTYGLASVDPSSASYSTLVSYEGTVYQGSPADANLMGQLCNYLYQNGVSYNWSGSVLTVGGISYKVGSFVYYTNDQYNYWNQYKNSYGLVFVATDDYSKVAVGNNQGYIVFTKQ